MLPKLPTSADSSIVAFRASEITKVLEAAGGNVAVTANGMLADALSQGDTVKVGILAGGLLGDIYARLGVDPGVRQQLFAKTLAQSQGDSSSSAAGAKLLALLSQGGEGTFYGYRDWLNATLAGQQGNFDRSLAGYIAIGGVADPRDLGPAGQPGRAVPQSIPAWPGGAGPDMRQRALFREAMLDRMRQQD